MKRVKSRKPSRAPAPKPAAFVEAPPPVNHPPLTELLRQLATELMFAEPDNDTGLLPLNHLLLQMEEMNRRIPLPAPFQSALANARQAVDRLFTTTARFDEPSLSWLREWNNWMQSALEPWRRGEQLPAPPAAWSAEPASRHVRKSNLPGGPHSTSSSSAGHPGGSRGRGRRTRTKPAPAVSSAPADPAPPAEAGSSAAADAPTVGSAADAGVTSGGISGASAPAAEADDPLLDLLRKLAMELMFAEPGTDNGLLPLNSLLLQVEALTASHPPPFEVQQAIQSARTTVQHIFDRTALFEESSLAWLRHWNVWMQSALAARDQGQSLPPAPAAWTGGEAHSAAAEPAVIPAAPAPVADAQPAVAASAVAAAQSDPAAAELAMELNLETDADLLREFVTESQEHLQNIELGVLVLEDNPTDADTLNSIFRAFHTFKGGSGFLHLTPVNRLAHELESLLDLARQEKLVVTSALIDLILEGADCLKQFVNEIQRALTAGQAEPVTIPTQSLVARVRRIILQPDAASLPPPDGSTPGTALEPVKFAVAPSGHAPGATAKAGSPPARAAGHSLGEGAAVKVDTHKLDSLMDLVGELVIAQCMVAQDDTVKSLQSQRLNRNLARLNGITRELQKITMSLRMVPIRPTFQKMNRLVRDLAAKQGKQVELQMSGEDTELDRTITEELTDPLVHMIRNSVDHGIETPDQRRAQGKPPHGTVWLRAFHEGGNILVEIKDDGAGINPDRLLAKAREKGLVRPDEPLSEREIFDLIFAPGFSTAAQVTDISGRGVGMDVVRRNVEKMRGQITIASVLGQGSTFTIALPLTLAIIDGFIVGVGKERFILPTYCVRESFRPTAAMLATVHGRGEMVNMRGRLSPLLRLHEFFGVAAAATDPTQGILLLVEYDNERRCLLVDELLGKQEVVIKSLGETFKQSPALAGAAILGDGRVGLILDVASLVKGPSQLLRQAA